MKKTLLLLSVLFLLVSCKGASSGGGESRPAPKLEDSILVTNYIRFTPEVVEGKSVFEAIIVSGESAFIGYYHRASGGGIEKVLEETNFFVEVLSSNEIEITSQVDPGDIRRIRFEDEFSPGRRTICLNEVCNVYDELESGKL